MMKVNANTDKESQLMNFVALKSTKIVDIKMVLRFNLYIEV